MLKVKDLKTWLHRQGLSRREKLLIVLATFDSPCQRKEIINRAEAAGLRGAKKWSPSDILRKSKGLAILTADGWEITESGKQHLNSLGVSEISAAATQVASDIRAALANIADSDTRKFVEEAIKCYEFGFYRPAAVMSWLAAVHTLHKYVHSNHLAAFNAEACRVDGKWKPAKSTDDLGRMGERDFLDRMAAISLIGKNVKNELIKCLDLRNGCGHPNSLKVGANTVAHHLEILLLNVFQPFS